MAEPRGAGGSRTLVQTDSQSAFYMLSTVLVVGKMPLRYQATFSVVPKISKTKRNILFSILSFPMLLTERQQDELPGKQLGT